MIIVSLEILVGRFVSLPVAGSLGKPQSATLKIVNDRHLLCVPIRSGGSDMDIARGGIPYFKPEIVFLF